MVVKHVPRRVGAGTAAAQEMPLGVILVGDARPIRQEGSEPSPHVIIGEHGGLSGWAIARNRRGGGDDLIRVVAGVRGRAVAFVGGGGHSAVGVVGIAGSAEEAVVGVPLLAGEELTVQIMGEGKGGIRGGVRDVTMAPARINGDLVGRERAVDAIGAVVPLLKPSATRKATVCCE